MMPGRMRWTGRGDVGRGARDDPVRHDASALHVGQHPHPLARPSATDAVIKLAVIFQDRLCNIGGLPHSEPELILVCIAGRFGEAAPGNGQPLLGP